MGYLEVALKALGKEKVDEDSADSAALHIAKSDVDPAAHATKSQETEASGSIHLPPELGLVLPRGVRLIRYRPKQPPVMIESYSIVTDVQKFVEAELQELDARLHAPIQIRGGFGIFTILDWLAQCGVELEITKPVAATARTSDADKSNS